MKTIREINKLIIDVDSATILLYFKFIIEAFSQGMVTIINIPIIGINNNKISNIYVLNQRKKNNEFTTLTDMIIWVYEELLCAELFSDKGRVK